ncbi:MAG: class I SAM-dependent methyltransferase [Thermoplasmata archaeon]|nr:class I SAM-dependent methyltransferase [Thermoplasmata archaeon]
MRHELDPDAGWVAGLSNCPNRRASELLRQASAERILYQHLAREHAREGRASYVEIDAPLELYALARRLRPRHVVEVGVSSGVSSAYLLAALDRNGSGTLHSIDLPSFPRAGARRTASAHGSWTLPPGRTSGWAVPFELRKRWDLRLGDKQAVLPLLAEELPAIELFVYDVPHEDKATFREFLCLDPRMAAGAVAIADHGPNGGLCEALARWARKRAATPLRRTGLGLFGFRCG